jgi:hypothetical protein
MRSHPTALQSRRLRGGFLIVNNPHPGHDRASGREDRWYTLR